MTKNIKIASIILCILIGSYFIINKNQNDLIRKSTSIFSGNPNDIFKILIQNKDEAIELTRVDTTWKISGNDTLIIKSRSLDNFFNNVGVLIIKNVFSTEMMDKYNTWCEHYIEIAKYDKN